VLIMFVGAVGVARQNPGPGGKLGLLLGLIATAAALVLRHRAPLAVLAVALAITLAFGKYGSIVLLAVLLAVFTVAEYRDRPAVLGAGAVTAVALVAAPAIHGGPIVGRSVLSHLIAVGLAVAVGLYVRARADYVTGLRDRAERLERERELQSNQAVADERLRIARELHDVVAHNVSLMVVQSQALAATGGVPADGEAALHRVADLGREALSEMHRMLGVLRLQNPNVPEREPQPAVRDLARLIARTREAGLHASLVVEGPPRELPPGVETSAYRIVQEALTNTIRHGGAKHATVTLSYAPKALELTVTDDGSGTPAAGANGSSPGHGLVGMRERVALFGGELTVGGRSDGPGYRVHALLPLG
jgi:signal transduction histidine kinase